MIVCGFFVVAALQVACFNSVALLLKVFVSDYNKNQVFWDCSKKLITN